MAYFTSESMYGNTENEADSSGRLVTSERVPFRFEDRDDNVVHVAGEGDTWDSLAEKYYHHISERACGLWWVIMDYQPSPEVDPTLKIRPGSVIYIPAPVVVVDLILPVDPEVYL